MAKNTNVESKQVLFLAIGLIVLVVIVIGYAANRHTAPVSYGKDDLTSPTPSTQSGNGAKSAQSSATPTPTPAPSDSMESASTKPNSGSFITNFQLSVRNGGQFVVNTLSANAASGTCSVTFSPNSGTAVTKTGSVVSTGQLTCDFGGAIAVSGNGSASLTVTGADGKTETKTASF